MPSYNKTILIGHLTRDPQVKYLPSQTAVTEFGLAVNHKFKTKDGGDREEVLFIDCAAFGKGGELIAQYVVKGKPLLVEGRLKYDTWEDKQGNKRSKISLVVDNFQFLGGRDDSGAGQDAGSRQPPRSQGAGRPQQMAATAPEKDFDQLGSDDVPFYHEDHRTPA